MIDDEGTRRPVYVLRKASEARVDTRLRRYYLIVLLPPTVFTSLSSFEFNIVGYGAPHDA